MNKALLILGLLMLNLSGCAGRKSANEQFVLKELRRLESNTNTGLNYGQYSDRLLTATAEIDVALKDNSDPAFVSRVREIQSCYHAARGLWEESVRTNARDQSQLQKFWMEASEKLDRLGKYVEADFSERKSLDEEDRRTSELKASAEMRLAEMHRQEWEAENNRLITEDNRREADKKAREEQQKRSEQEADQKRKEADEVAAKIEHARRYAPEGTLLLITTVTAHIKGGLAGITPGTEVTVLRKNPNGTLHIKEKTGTLEADIKSAWATDDRDFAAEVKLADEGEQAQAFDDINQIQADAARRRRDEQIRAGRAMDDASSQFHGSQINLGTNPLDGVLHI